MTDDLYDRFRRAADPDGRRPRTTPAQVLDRARRDRRRYRAKAAGATGTALATGAVAAVLAAGAIVPTGDGGSEPNGPTDQRGQASGRTVPLYLGPLTDARTQRVLADCAGHLDDEPSDYRVVLAGRYDADWRPVDVVVATTTDGARVIDCIGTRYANGYSVEAGAFDELPTAPTPEPDAEHPLVRLSPTESSFDCDVERNVRFSTDGVWKAADSVDRVEVRVTEPGRRQPWRVAPVHDGFVYWSGWSETVLEQDEVLRVAWRAYDTDGELIDADLMPVRSWQRPVPSETLRLCDDLEG